VRACRLEEQSVNVEESDEIHARELARRLCEDSRPLCPQFRMCDLERLYPVKGYCVLAQAPGWFMIPSTEEQREYCTTPRFGDCCWFRGTGENSGSSEGEREAHLPRVDVWQPPGVAQPTRRKSS
jgi:hypothetical protein